MNIIYLGSLLPRRGGEGAQRNARIPEVEERILEQIEENPSNSIRKLATQIGTTKWVVHETLKEQLLHPYHVQKVHGMSPEDYPARLDYANWFLQIHRENNNFSGIILFTDEAGFTRDGIINSHNLHIWAEENPRAIIQTKHQQRFMVNVWAGIIGNNLIGPFFLDDRLNGARYLHFLQQYLNELLEDVPLHIRASMWFMHDGAPPHFDRLVRQHLTAVFGQQWIGRGGPSPWPARSPDLNPLDFFFWGYLKELVYSTPVNTREDLVLRIRQYCGQIRNNPGTLFAVQRENLRRIRKCIQVQGGHIEHLLK